MTRPGGMSLMQRAGIDHFYAVAGDDPAKLPWRRAEPDALLARVASGRAPGRALDVGCGSGEMSAYLASLGYAVTAIDIHPAAIAMARRVLADTSVEVIERDVFAFEPVEPFDLVLDSGCLHCIADAGARAYRHRLLNWLALDGDFVLEHWDKRHPLDWRPIGPIRRARPVVERLFAPELRVVEAASEEFLTPFPIGPRVRGTAYHLRRSAES